MDASVVDQQDATSDYGSDFTPDEEVILDSLLQQHHVLLDPDLDLLLADIENDETFHYAQIPFRRPNHKTRSNSGPPLWQFYAKKRKISIEIEDYKGPSSTRKSYPLQCGID